MKVTYSILTLSLIALIAIGCNNTKKEVKNEPVAAPVEQTKVAENSSAKLDSKLVCFVNNKYMGIAQIPVEVEGKTYYGCCQDCVVKINNMREVRFAQDPLTGIEVDKALAYIVLSPLGNNDVLYFESEQNYLAFTEKS